MGMSLSQAQKNAARTESIGHLVVWGDFEYFMVNRQIFRANVNNPMGTDGFRQGARYECTLEQWTTLKGILGIPSI
jgi:hypothetical protein